MGFGISVRSCRRVWQLEALALSVLVGPSYAQPTPLVRDSAGIRIIEHATLPLASLAFRIEEAPQLIFGGLKADTTQEFGSTASFSLGRLSDGRVVLADRDNIKFFDRAGKFLQRVGRRGTGPGEFNSISQICVTGRDSIMVIENGLGRLHLLGPNGQHVRTGNIMPRGTVVADACFSDGSFVVQGAARPNPNSTLPVERARSEDAIRVVWLADRSGSGRDTVGQFAASPTGVATVLSVVVQDSTLVVGNGSAPSFDVRSKDGRIIRIVRWQARREFVEPRASNPVGTPAANAPIPFYAGIRVDDEGRVWIRSHSASARPNEYTVFSAGGMLLGRVMLPELRAAESQPSLMGFHNGEALLLWKDTSTGAVHLSSHRLLAARSI